MKEFLDSLDEKMIGFFKSMVSRKSKAPKEVTVLAPTDVGAPTFFMMGSLAGGTLKDAMSYARGIAETFITAPDISRLRVYDDKPNKRFIYEICEGGPGFSVVEKVLELLASGQKVRVHLINDARAVIEETHGEVFSLVYPASDEELKPAQLAGLETQEDEGHLWKIQDLCGTVELMELYPQKRALAHVGGVVLGVAISLFMVSGGIYTVVRSGVFDGDALLRQTKAGYLTDTVDNPVWQLDKARNAAEKGGKALSALKKGPSGWTWELEK